MGRFETKWLAAEKNLSALSTLSGQLIDRVHGRRPPRGIVLDMDSSVSPTHGEQEMSVEPFQTAGHAVEWSGPDVRLTPKQALSFSMALHELATNATKYGALSTPVGRATITWSIIKDTKVESVQMTWSEEGGPLVALPTQKGFGSRFIEKNLAHDLGGDSRVEYRTEGVVAVLNSPLELQGG